MDADHDTSDDSETAEKEVVCTEKNAVSNTGDGTEKSSDETGRSENGIEKPEDGIEKLDDQPETPEESVESPGSQVERLVGQDERQEGQTERPEGHVVKPEAQVERPVGQVEQPDLPPEEWTPQKPQSRIKVAVRKLPPSIRGRCDKKRVYSYDEIIQLVEERIQMLLKKREFLIPEIRADLKFVQRQTRYSPDVVLSKRIVDRIVHFGIAHVYLRVWQSVQKVQYLDAGYLSAFKNLQTIISIIWNCTDKSAPLCESLIRCSVIQLLISELSEDKLIDSDLVDVNVLYLVKAYLGILHNIVRHCSESRKLFRAANAVNILNVYVNSDQPLVKAKAYLILSYIINEHENELVNSTDDNITFIIKILEEALNSENHFSKTYAFWATEIACGLNHLAVNDANKIRIGRLGAIPLYLKLLRSSNEEEQSLGAAGLWIFAFKDENKSIIRETPGCIEVLQEFASNSSSEHIRRAARGALWVTRTVGERPTAIAISQDAEVPHVMISYHWLAQQTMLKVRNRLKAAGYKVWMDVDNMSGSTLEAMALAVERSAVVLTCMSQGYKDSASCRTEAEYTYRLRKDIIPLLLQPAYEPDGWLGIMVGTKLYFDFSKESNIDSQMPKLLKEIGNRGRIPGRNLSSQSSSRESLDCFLSLSPCGGGGGGDTASVTSVSSLHSYRVTPTAGTWTTEDIKGWLEANGLGHVVERFLSFTGELLLQYKKMMRTAPEFFYRSLETQLRFDIVTILKFTKALEEL